MSCNKCEVNQDKGMVAYYRVGSANVGIIGCEEHVLYVFEAIAEKKKKDAEDTQNE